MPAPGSRDWLSAQPCAWPERHACAGPRAPVAVRPVENLRHVDGRAETVPLCAPARQTLRRPPPVSGSSPREARCTETPDAVATRNDAGAPDAARAGLQGPGPAGAT